MQHRRRTGPAARVRAISPALGLLLACGSLAATTVAASGGAAPDPGSAVVQIARNQVGDAYQWGGNGPDAWDCSGLTSRLWREVGGVADIPRVSRDQHAWAVPIPAEQLLAGDLVFFGDPVNHVSLYAGDGIIIDGSSSKKGVVERKIWPASVIRYGRVPRPGMPKVRPWTPPSPTPTASASPTSGTTAPAVAAAPSPKASVKPATKPATTPATKPSPSPAPTRTGTGTTTAAVSTAPLRGLPAPDLAAITSVAAKAVHNAQTVRGSKAWTDLSLVQAAWRHAGGGQLPASRVDLVAAGTAVPISAARIGDLVVYGAPATHLGLYLGHGYMVDVSQTTKQVVVRRVYASSTARIVRPDVR